MKVSFRALSSECTLTRFQLWFSFQSCNYILKWINDNEFACRGHSLCHKVKLQLFGSCFNQALINWLTWTIQGMHRLIPDKINTLIRVFNSSVVSSLPVYSSFPDLFALIPALERAEQASSGRAVPACRGGVHPAPGSRSSSPEDGGQGGSPQLCAEPTGVNRCRKKKKALCFFFFSSPKGVERRGQLSAFRPGDWCQVRRQI